jgi:phage terminase small subunit
LDLVNRKQKGGEAVRTPKKMNEKHKAFVRKYVECGNRTTAYLAVYKGVKERGTASTNASVLMKNPAIKAYYDELIQAVTADDIADIREVLTTFTKVLRREMYDLDKDGEQIPPRVADVVRAGEALLRHIGVGAEVEENKAQSGVILMPEVKTEEGE